MAFATQAVPDEHGIIKACYDVDPEDTVPQGTLRVAENGLCRAPPDGVVKAAGAESYLGPGSEYHVAGREISLPRYDSEDFIIQGPVVMKRDGTVCLVCAWKRSIDLLELLFGGSGGKSWFATTDDGAITALSVNRIKGCRKIARVSGSGL